MARWIHRRGSKATGFRYVDDNGRPVRDRRVLERINDLVIPPAWRDVHIAVSPSHAIQAWGYDARGRRQYRYHDAEVKRGELRKYYRVRELAKRMPRIRRTLREDARRQVLSRNTVAATVLRLIGETFCRVGGDRYVRENGTFGITTIRKSHARLARGVLRLEYVGKGKIRQRQIVADRELSRLVARQLACPGSRLFRYRDADGWHDLTARDVNEYLHERIGRQYSAKDFRTWGGTLRAATVLAELGPARSPTEAKRNVALAMRLVGSELGNTPTICRKSYVHPMVVARYIDEGETIALPRARKRAADRGRPQSPEERALIAFLDAHFPDRRRRTRAQARPARSGSASRSPSPRRARHSTI